MLTGSRLTYVNPFADLFRSFILQEISDTVFAQNYSPFYPSSSSPLEFRSELRGIRAAAGF